MTLSEATVEQPSLIERTRAVDYPARVCEALRCFAGAADEADAVETLSMATERIGADHACFVSFMCDDDKLAALRCLLACDPLWSAEYLKNTRLDDDPWLVYAVNHADPIRASELPAKTVAQRRVVEAAHVAGFCSTIIAPAPSSAGKARVGALYLGSATPGYFESAGYRVVRPLARAMAMEVHEWWRQKARADLAWLARITDDDLVLLEHGGQGHGSKVIAAALHTEPKTIDCRFQRVNAKLGVDNRRAAVRLARLYGLI